MTCERYENDLALHVEGDLAEAATLRLEQHLAGCDHCRTFLNELQLSQRAVKALVGGPVPEEALRRVRLRVGDAIGLAPRSRASFGPAWAWALAASGAFVVVGAAVVWRLSASRPETTVESAGLRPSSPTPDVAAPLPSRGTTTPNPRGLAPTGPTASASRPVSQGEEQAMTAEEAPLSPDEADQLARAVVAVSQIASLSDLPRHQEAEDQPSSGRFARLATDNPNVVIYWQLDSNGE